jgi:hypothetical protein
MVSAVSQLSDLVSRYSPIVARQFRSARSSVRKYFPRGYELVFENFNALGCGYSSTKLGSGVVVSIVAYPKWVTLFFFYGNGLSDPSGLLQGNGTRIRSIRLLPFSLLRSVSVHDLLVQETKRHQGDFAGEPPLTTIVRSVANKRRSRRPASAAKAPPASKAKVRGKRMPSNKSLKRSRER